VVSAQHAEFDWNKVRASSNVLDVPEKYVYAGSHLLVTSYS
jgi:hypothetical protein